MRFSVTGRAKIAAMMLTRREAAGSERRQVVDSVEKLDSQGCASSVEKKADRSDRARIDDRDHGKGEATPEEVLRTDCIELFIRIGRQRSVSSLLAVSSGT